MNSTSALSTRRNLLAKKLTAILRMRHHLDFSLHRLVFPLSSVDGLDDPALESVSALIDRFGKLQDMLGNVFREILLLSGEDVTDMNDFLSRLEKLAVLDSADDWRALRALRNLGAHDYDEDDQRKTDFINELAAQSAMLLKAVERVLAYCSGKLGLRPAA